MGRRIAETERLIIRTHEAGDVEPLARLWCDPMATTYMGGPRDFDRVCQSIRDDVALPEQPTFDLWTVIERATGAVIGHCGLLDKEIEGHPEIELVYLIVPRLWRRGYATEASQAIKTYALTRLSRDRLVALVHPDNQPSARVAEKLGFRLDHAVERPHGTMHLYAFTAEKPPID
jgi:[ribosomal protein S5]-alanine N-acetyltransferase